MIRDPSDRWASWSILAVLLGPAAAVFALSVVPPKPRNFVTVEVRGMHLARDSDLTWSGADADVNVPGLGKDRLVTRVLRDSVRVTPRNLSADLRIRPKRGPVVTLGSESRDRVTVALPATFEVTRRSTAGRRVRESWTLGALDEKGDAPLRFAVPRRIRVPVSVLEPAAEAKSRSAIVPISSGPVELAAGTSLRFDSFSSLFEGTFAYLEVPARSREYRLRTVMSTGRGIRLDPGKDVVAQVFAYGPWLGALYLAYLAALGWLLLAGVPGRTPGYAELAFGLAGVPRVLWLIGGLSGLLAFRLLFGIHAALLPPFSPDALRESVAGAILLPAAATGIALAALASRTPRGSWADPRGLSRAVAWALLPLAAAAVLAFAIDRFLGGRIVDGIGVVVLLATGAAMILATPALLHRAWNLRPSWNVAAVVVWILVVAVLAVIGSERLILGLRTSTVFLVIALLVFAHWLGLLMHLRTHDRQGNAFGVRWVTGVVLLLLGFLLVAWRSHDYGLLLYAGGIACLFIDQALRYWKGRALAALVVGGAAVAALLFVVVGRIDLDRADYATYRLLQPWTNLERVGTEKSELLLTQVAEISPYVARLDRPVGAGYLQTFPSKRLLNWVLSDMAVASLLFAEFGWSGVLVFGLCLGFLVVGVIGLAGPWRASPGRYLVPGHSHAQAILRALAYAALMTVILQDLFMVGANLNWLPLVGKNVFGFGVNSVTDLVEVLVLWTFMLWGAVEGDVPIASSHRPEP